MRRAPRLPSLSDCRDCGEPIRFVLMQATGRALPVNPTPNHEKADGNVAAHLAGGRLVGFVISRDRLPGPFDVYRFTPHHATCEALQAKRSNTTTTTPDDPALF